MIGICDTPTELFEEVFANRAQADAVGAWKQRHNVRRVAIADFSKNLYATYTACRQASLEVGALLDHRDAFKAMTYRGLPIVQYSNVSDLKVDGVVVSNTNPAQVDARAEQVRRVTAVPVLTLWAPRYMGQPEAPRTTQKAA